MLEAFLPPYACCVIKTASNATRSFPIAVACSNHSSSNDNSFPIPFALLFPYIPNQSGSWLVYSSTPVNHVLRRRWQSSSLRNSLYLTSQLWKKEQNGAIQELEVLRVKRDLQLTIINIIKFWRWQKYLHIKVCVFCSSSITLMTQLFWFCFVFLFVHLFY